MFHLFYLTVTSTLQNEYYYPHCTDEKTEAQWTPEEPTQRELALHNPLNKECFLSTYHYGFQRRPKVRPVLKTLMFLVELLNRSSKMGFLNSKGRENPGRRKVGKGGGGLGWSGKALLEEPGLESANQGL